MSCSTICICDKVPSFTFLIRLAKKETIQESEAQNPLHACMQHDSCMQICFWDPFNPASVLQLEQEDNAEFCMSFLASFAHNLPSEGEMKAILHSIKKYICTLDPV